MPRTGGVTAEQVESAAEALMAINGRSSVTLRGVRATLGRGSLQTIHRHLAAWHGRNQAGTVTVKVRHPDELAVAAAIRDMSPDLWVERAIEEKLRSDRLEDLMSALGSPEHWSAPRKHALTRLTFEAGTRSREAPTEDDLVTAFRDVAGGNDAGLALVRRVLADGHPHDIYQFLLGERNVETLLDRAVSMQPSFKPIALRIGMDLRLDGHLMLNWLPHRGKST